MGHIAFEALVIAFVLMIISFFNGGVRYLYGDKQFPPVWIQLLFNFAIYFVVCFVVYALANWLYAKVKKK